EDFLTLLAIVKRDKECREEMISTMVQKMGMFSPEKVGNYIERIDIVDRAIVAEALADRIRNLRGDKMDKINLANQYIQAIGDAQLLGPLVKSHIALSAEENPIATLDWIKQQ